MIFQPAIMALLLASFMISGMALYASFFGIRIIRRWDITNGSEGQLELERRTYLISTIFSYMLAFQAGSLFLYIFTADNLHTLFTGAMCAAGTLNVNPYGYPALLLKLLNFILAGAWLVVNYTDNRAYDYPLIKTKYALLLLLAPLILTEAVVQALYFLHLKADVITSCCGTLFSADGRTIASDIASAPPAVAMTGFVLSLGAILPAGGFFVFKGRLGLLFSALALISFLVFGVSLISFISVYIYELPTHHCPFCILQKEYGYVGYVLYGSLLAGVVSGLGVGALTPFEGVASLSGILPLIRKRLTLVCLVAYLLFAAIAIYRMAATDFTLGFAGGLFR